MSEREPPLETLIAERETGMPRWELTPSPQTLAERLEMLRLCRRAGRLLERLYEPPVPSEGP